jgi:hypothetical protein
MVDGMLIKSFTFQFVLSFQLQILFGFLKDGKM